MIKENNNIDLKEYKGAIIDYSCEECQISEEFFEVFKNEISRIKSRGCSHFNLKFIYNYDRGKFKYILSFNCNKCDFKKMLNLFDENSTESSSNIEIKCEKCNEGSMYILLLLSKDYENEEIKDVNNQEHKNYENDFIRDSNNQININYSTKNNQQLIGGGQFAPQEDINNNDQKEKIFITPDEINLIFKDINGNKYELYISSKELLSKAIRILINQYKQINSEKISEFCSGGIKLDVKKTLIENKLKNDSIIIIHYYNE